MSPGAVVIDWPPYWRGWPRSANRSILQRFARQRKPLSADEPLPGAAESPACGNPSRLHNKKPRTMPGRDSQRAKTIAGIND